MKTDNMMTIRYLIGALRFSLKSRDIRSIQSIGQSDLPGGSSMRVSGWMRVLALTLIATTQFGCSTRYLVKTYPAGAQVYTRDLTSNEKKLIGVSPVEIAGEAKLGDVFFVVVEKQNYKPKEILVRASEGETLAINAKLDPLNTDEIAA